MTFARREAAAHEKVLLIHTGGLQGLDGWHYRFGKG
jgi:1-aminocyclopropane-1-carboxylate deaminase/D-cysteine desulfhydrase-like pyridoxal-dependent ACC family enzyme